MRISVIIPARNASRTIRATLDSVFAETRWPHEVIVVDDGSDESIADSLRPYEDRLTFVRIPHSGAAAARNAGAKLATGDALFFCDADLELDPTMFDKLAVALERDPRAAFAYCSFIWHGRTFVARPFDAETLKRNNYVSTMSLLRRESFPGFDESLPRFQDWDLWLTVVERSGRGVAVPEVLFRVMEEGTLSRRGGLSRLVTTAKIRSKHHLPWRASDFWLAFKESVKARRL
jgi:glycosyltransferase involved in cell wall biosynthesis